MIEEYNEIIFERIKHIDELGNEYWEARELQKVLEYAQWRRFNEVIERAIISCNMSEKDSLYHFAKIGKMVDIGSGTQRRKQDYKLSRYACYLIVQNGNPKKKTIALGQTYFTVQTRKQEISEEEYSKLNEEEKRLYRRKLTKDGNKLLYKIAVKKGVKNFDKFTNSGYKGMYNGETADDIAKKINTSNKK